MSRIYKTGSDRRQGCLLPPSVEEYVSADNPVRVIDAYVEGLNFKELGFAHADGEVGPGQPAFSPGTLMRLYLYGYLMKVRSSRSLERECYRNLEAMWLMSGLKPSNRTIASFRANNAKALKAVSKDFVLICRELNLYGRELVAIDGSFFRANASKSRIFTKERLARLTQRVEADISQYLAQLDSEDAAEGSSEAANLEEKLQQLRERQAKLHERANALAESGQTQLSEVDPDARRLKKHGQNVTGYNVQMAVDSQNKLLVACEVTSDGNDQGQLAPMAQIAKEALEVEQLDVVADSGYFNPTQLKTCLDHGITPHVAESARKGPSSAPGRLSREQFIYNEQDREYRCPQGMVLSYKRTIEQKGVLSSMFASRKSDCANCPLRGSCLSSKTPRREIYRSEHEPLLRAHRERMAATGEERMRQRAATVEHPFGTLKRWLGWNHFLVRGRQKVSGEMGLLTLAYNLRRVITLKGVSSLITFFKSRSTLGTAYA